MEAMPSTVNPDRPSTKRPAWTQRTLRAALCLAALSIAALAAGTVASATTTSSDPNWGGSTPVRISHGNQDEALWPAIAVNSLDEVAVIWSDERSGARNIYFTEYAGTSWSTPQVITSTANDSTQSDLLAVGDQFFAAWIEPIGSKVYVTRLGSGQLSPLTTPNPPVDDSRPSIVEAQNRLHIVFSVGDGFGIPDLYLATRPVASTGWTYFGPIYVSPAALGAWWPAMAVSPDEQTLHLVWQEWSATARAIYYISGTVSGGSVTWSTTPVLLSTDHSQAIRPDIAVDDDGNVHVTWTEIGPYGYDEQYVRYTRLDDGSTSWLPSRRIDDTHVEANEIAPTFVAARVAAWTDSESGDTTVCASWHGFRDGDPTAEEALLTCSQDGGNTWDNTQNVSRSTTPGGADEISIRPTIEFDSSGDLHVAWQEFSVGGDVLYDYEIFYSRGGVSGGPVYLPLMLRNH